VDVRGLFPLTQPRPFLNSLTASPAFISDRKGAEEPSWERSQARSDGAKNKQTNKQAENKLFFVSR